MENKVSNLIFNTKGDAQAVLDWMGITINAYGRVTVAGAYDFAGYVCSVSDHKYGWTTIDSGLVVQNRYGWAIHLPDPIELGEPKTCDTKRADDDILTIVIPNVESHMDQFSLCPKEVMQKAYLDKLGKTVDVHGRSMIVLSVKIDQKNITIELV